MLALRRMPGIQVSPVGVCSDTAFRERKRRNTGFLPCFFQRPIAAIGEGLALRIDGARLAEPPLHFGTATLRVSRVVALPELPGIAYNAVKNLCAVNDMDVIVLQPIGGFRGMNGEHIRMPRAKLAFQIIMGKGNLLGPC